MATFNLKNRVRRKLQRIHGKVFLASFKGDEYYCNICDHSFNRMLYLHDGYTIRGAYSDHSMANAICPNCGSWFRHRMMKSYIEQNDFLSKGHEVSIGGSLYSDALGDAGTVEGTYLGMFRYNVNSIVKALK